jgi:hypothetical protein
MRPLILLLVLSSSALHALEVVISRQHVIHHAADAPDTAKLAAKELQQVIQAASGIELAITSEKVTPPAIRIVSDSRLPHDGFEIRAEGADVIIAGNDDAHAGTWTLPSHGSLFGAQEFLERFLGVRWLSPGELGQDVPKTNEMRIDMNEPIRGAPGFASRSLAYVGETDREITRVTSQCSNG